MRQGTYKYHWYRWWNDMLKMLFSYNDALAKAFDRLKEAPGDFFSSEELAADNNALKDFISNSFDKEYGVDDYFIVKK